MMSFREESTQILLANELIADVQTTYASQVEEESSTRGGELPEGPLLVIITSAHMSHMAVLNISPRTPKKMQQGQWQ